MATKKTTRGRRAASRKTTASRRSGKDFARHQAWAIVLFALAILLACILLIPNPGSGLWSFLQNNLLRGLFGIGAYLVPVAIGAAAVLLAMGRPLSTVRFWSVCGLLTLVISLVYTFRFGSAWQTAGVSFGEALGRCFADSTLDKIVIPGLWGTLLGWPLFALLNFGAHIVLILLLFISLMLLTRTGIISLFRTMYKPVKPAVDTAITAVDTARTNLEERRKNRARIDVDMGDGYDTIDLPLDVEEFPDDTPAEPVKSRRRSKLEAFTDATQKMDDMENGEPARPTDSIDADAFAADVPADAASDAAEEQDSAPFTVPEDAETGEAQTYLLPPLSLLEKSSGGGASSDAEARRNGEILVRTLNDFGVSTRLVGVTPSASVTRYELEPSPGVKISRITGLSDDLALRLSISGVRISPIAGKAAVGVEVPNKERSSVTLGDVLDTPTFTRSKGALTVALGKDVDGNIVCADLQRMPHLLIAGTTGSGKSVCTNAMIQSVLFHARPDEVKLMLIDPKRGVEFGVYNGVPHLLVPVVDDPRKAAGALGWAVNEMTDRYKKFADCKVSDVRGYNELMKEQGAKPLPLILIIIDELSELMMLAAKEVESSIIHLAQMARAAGIHMVLATQRPSADVITGLIRANIPSRLALTVANGIESRIILDAVGAEKLLGYGDMLFQPVGSPKPLRIQGCFVSDREVGKVVDYIRNSNPVPDTGYDKNIMDQIEVNAAAAVDKAKGTDADEGTGFDEAGDEEFRAAVEAVIEAGAASVSMLQRRLRVGYAHAGRLIDEMEKRGIVGPHEGSKSRAVLITRVQWQEMCLRQSDQ